MNSAYDWYAVLIKPSWAPPGLLFGPVWTVLYLIIAISFTSVFYQTATGKLPRRAAFPFVLNLVFNLAFTPLQFGLRNNLLAAIDILLVLVTLTWSFISLWPRLKWVVFANAPYFLWVSFATVLQLTVTVLNWK